MVDSSLDEAMDFSVLSSTLWRGKWSIALTTIVFIMLGGFYSFVGAIPKYRSSATVILETSQEAVVDFHSVVSGLVGDTTEVNSELEVLRSRGLLGKVVDKLNLISDPEFNEDLKGPSKIEWIGRIFDFGLHQIQIGQAQQNKTQMERDSVISSLIESVSIRNIPQSLVFEVVVETQSAIKSALIADTIVEVYILDQIETKFNTTEQATAWLTNRVVDLQQNLEFAESELSEFNSATTLISPEALKKQEIQLKDMRERMEAVRTQKNTAQARLDKLQSVETPAKQVETDTDPSVQHVFPEIFGSDDILVTADYSYQNELERTVLELERSTVQLESLTLASEELGEQVATQNSDLIRLKQLTREAEASRLLYEYFLTRLKETSAQQGIQKADSRQISWAVIPTEHSEPKEVMILTISAVLGLIVGSLIATSIESRIAGFRSIQEVEQKSGCNVLGQIPTNSLGGHRKTLEYLVSKPSSSMAEAVRNLRTSLMLSNVDNPPKVIVMTSALPGEGKTTNSLALAQNFVGIGKKVLLIDGDVRRQTLSEHFQEVPERGIVSVVTGKLNTRDVVFRDALLGCDIMAGETAASINAADIFASERFRLMIDDIRSQYDVIIIDTPPMLLVSDARLISRHADAVLLTVKWKVTPQKFVLEVIRLFLSDKRKVSGIVFSQIAHRSSKHYGFLLGGKEEGYYLN